jgi:uncharacterized metal-binding protein
MKCPRCGKKMSLKGRDSSYDFKVKPRRKYKRDVYWCKADDVWINIEIPSK